MSYTRRYRERISVPYSGSVSYSYPASQNGGSGTAHYSGTTYEDINVTIDVDTDAFDSSVENCNTNINLLTGAVVATETAQIASIDKNAKKVAGTIINGFFGYIRSEISQQIAELSQGIDSQLMHLRELSKAVVDKKKQMEGDFFRISSRYFKIFDDLNNELSNRIFELDKPTFVFKKELNNQENRVTNNDLVNTISIFGKEGSELQSKISSSIAKKRAFDTLNKSKIYLWQQNNLNIRVQKSMINESIESSQNLPICLIETISEKNQMTRRLYTQSYFEILKNTKVQNLLIEKFQDSSNSWGPISAKHQDNLKLYFNQEIKKTFLITNQHSARVKDMIFKIANFNVIETISLK